MSEYLIIINEVENQELTPEEETHCINEYGKWAQLLGKKHLTGRRLDEEEEAVLLPSKKSLTTDGPFVEAKELIAGIILIEANSLEEAKSLAESCPLRDYFQLFVKKVKN